jgi:hypothetical protein
MLVVPLAGAAVGVLAIIYAEATGRQHPTCSSRDKMRLTRSSHAASYSVGVLLLVVCKGPRLRVS